MTLVRSIEVGGFWFATSLLVISVLGPARASEIFVCDDQSVIYVNSKNRAAMADHPCVKSWFERNRSVPVGKPAVAVSKASAAAAPAVANASAAAAPPEPSADAAPSTADTKPVNPLAVEDPKAPSTTKAGKRYRSF